MEDQNKKIQEMQMTEQGLQNILMQKQAFQMELTESQTSRKELEKSGDEVFKVVGQLMIKTDKESLKKELEEKEKIIKLRLDSLEKQESSLSEKLEEIRNGFLEK